MIKYKATPTSRKNIEQAVLELKHSFGIDKSLCFPVMHFIEWVLPELDNDFVLDIVPKEELIGKYAIAIPSQNTIRVREDVYDDACDDKPRARFTLCHELGHYFMHDEESVSLCRLADGEKIPPYKDPEWQANTFAGYLLMSPNLIQKMTLKEICDKCKVSEQAAKIQMKYL